MAVIAFIFGAVIGSFLSVCIYRLPLSRSVGLEDDAGNPVPPPVPDLSIHNPKRSFCPNCKNQLRWWHNIPIFSWIFLRGKCSFCATRISFRYPLVECLSAVSATLAVLMYGTTLTALLVFILCATLIVISFIDYDYYIIPNVISIPGTVIGLLCAVLNQYTGILGPPFVSGVLDASLGVLVGAGFLLVVSELYLRLRKQEGLGMGDVKLLALVGAFLGLPGAVFTIFVGSLIGTVGGVLMMLIARRGMSHPLPFGPYLALGTICYIFLGSAERIMLVPGIPLTFP